MVIEPDRIEALWRGGDERAALGLAREAAETGTDKLPLAEALLRCAGDPEPPEREDAARLAVTLRESVWPPGHPRAGYAAMPLADFLRRDGRLLEAEALLRRCQALAETTWQTGDSSPLRDITFALGKLHLAQGKPKEAEHEFLRAAEIEAAGRHPGRPPFTLALAELSALYMQQRRYPEAAGIIRQELMIGKGSGMAGLDQAVLNAELGRALLLASWTEEARAALMEALDILTKGFVTDPEPLLATVRKRLDEVSQASRRPVGKI